MAAPRDSEVTMTYIDVARNARSEHGPNLTKMNLLPATPDNWRSCEGADDRLTCRHVRLGRFKQPHWS